MRSSIIVIRLLLITVTLTACTEVVEVPSERIEVPRTIINAFDMVWSSSHGILLQTDDSLWIKAKDSASWEELPLVQVPECQKTHYYDIQELPTGDLGFIQSCVNAPPAQNWQTNRLVTYNIEDNTITLLSDVEIPETGNISWRDDLTLAIYNNSKYAFGTLYWISPTTIEPVALTLSEGSKEWFLPDSIDAKEEYEQQERPDLLPYAVGLVKEPQFLEGSIIFWATLDPQGNQFEFLSSQNYDLYRYDMRTGELELLLEDVREPDYTQLSSDKNWLAYAAEGEPGRSNLWLYSLRTGEKFRIARGNYRHLAWDPTTSNEIIALSCLDRLCSAMELIKYNLRELTAP